MRIILFCILFAALTNVNAQLAPDFSVTDSEDNSRMLFADYLDQGKTVVLEVFFTTCPPCNSLAPYLEPLYQNWGGGQADVEFIALSILQSDSDAKVNNYKANHNTTFPGVGGEGGSVAAVAPYKNGTFGNYTGTPLFVVIAPDKSVNYDVYGSGTQGQIDALDAAIEATGATGMPTATRQPEINFPFELVSTLVTDELILRNTGEPTEITGTFVRVTGQVFSSEKLPIENSSRVSLDASGLSSGSWILNVRDHKTNATQAFLFVKQ